LQLFSFSSNSHFNGYCKFYYNHKSYDSIIITNEVMNQSLLTALLCTLVGKVNKGHIPAIAQPGGSASLPVTVNPSTQARNSSTFPSSSSAYHTNAYSNQTNIKPGFEAVVAAEAVTSSSSSGPVEPVKKVHAQ
jgi:hypothetical protein